MISIQECRNGSLIAASFRLEGRSHQKIRCSFPKERVHQQRAFSGPRFAHRAPALDHPKHGASPRSIVEVNYDGETTAAFPSIVIIPFTAEYIFVYVSGAVPAFFPPLAAAAINMGAQSEADVAGLRKRSRSA